MGNFENDQSPNTDEQSVRPLLQDNQAKSLLESPNGDQTRDQNEVSVLIKDPSSPAPFVEQSQIKDRFYLIYIIFLLFGIATLLPWNIFITITPYFVDYKLNTTASNNTVYRDNFTFIVGLVGQITNVVMNFINIVLVFGGNPKNRIPYTIMLCSCVVVFQIILAIVDSQSWPFAFFILCCVSVFIMYIATGVLNSCTYYVVSIFPMEYVNALILGNNLSGVFTTLMSMISKAVTPNLRIAAIYYFVSAFVALMLAFIGYFLMHKLRYYKYWSELAERKKNEDNVENKNVKVPYVQLIKKTWLLLFCIWLNFFSTLAVFPVYLLGIQKSDPNYWIPDLWYQDVLIFLTFNILVIIGNMIPKVIRRPGPKWIFVPVIVRALLVFIFFALCNFKPEKRTNSFIPILIKNDWVYWAGCALSPITFGYLTSLLMMYTPREVPEHAGSLAMMAALVLTIGVTTGLNFSKIFEFIVLA